MPELQWGFPTQSTNNQFVGLNNAGAQAYVDDSISSIVREAIQNSLDAAISPQGEVGVNIAYGVMKREVHENIFNTILSIRTHIEWCRDEYRNLGQNHNSEVSYFDRMLERIERFNQLGRIPFLKIKDTGTIGMYHNAENPRTGRLCTFIQGDGVNNANNQNGGGANGIGKMAYFAMSPLNMVLVSTCAIENSDADRTTAQTFFSGSTKLTTHSNPNNPQEQYQYAGYLPTIPQNSIFEPLCGDDIDNELPFILTRRPLKNVAPELGTTIYIIGCEPNDLDNTKLENYESELLQKANVIYGEMAKAVLKNYWLAIYRGRLKIELGTSNPQNSALKINLENINRQLRNYFQEDHFGRQFRNYNPLHFVKALDPDGGNIRQYELDLDTSPELRRDKTWGKVRLYVNIDDTLQGNMIIAMRSPMMTVWRYKADTNAGSYAAVLVCDEEGNYCNELLRLAEPHTHDKWESAQVGQHGGNINDAQALLTVINQWVNQVINELFANKSSEAGRFLGMSEYLCFYNPEDASLRDSNLNKGNAMSGETSTIEIRQRKKKEPKGTKVSSIYTSATTPTTDEGPSTTGGDGNGTSNTDGDGPGYTNPNTKVKETSDGHQTSIVEEVNIKVRYFAQKEPNNNTWKYVVILNGNQDYKNIALRFEEQKENSSSEKNYLQISKISEGCIHKKDNTKVHSISLEANTPKRIEVEFKMNTRRIALKVTSTLYNTTEEETE